MNFLRRFAILLYGLALLALVSVVLLFPETVAAALQSLAGVNTTIRAAIAIVVAFIILIALFFLVRAPRFHNHEGLIVKTSGALADVGISSARDRILKAVEAVPNVVSADVKLQALQGKADVDLSVEVAGSNLNVPDKQREIDRSLRQVMLKQLGLQLANRPRVHIQLMTEDELRARDEAARRPVLPVAPAVTQPVGPAASYAPPVVPAPTIEPVLSAVPPVAVEAVPVVASVLDIPPVEVTEAAVDELDDVFLANNDDLPDFLREDFIVPEEPVESETPHFAPDDLEIPPASHLEDALAEVVSVDTSADAVGDDWLNPPADEDEELLLDEQRPGEGVPLPPTSD